jgi:hypothetical protein
MAYWVQQNLCAIHAHVVSIVLVHTSFPLNEEKLNEELYRRSRKVSGVYDLRIKIKDQQPNQDITVYFVGDPKDIEGSAKKIVQMITEIEQDVAEACHQQQLADMVHGEPNS